MKNLLVVNDITCCSKVASSIILPTTIRYNVDTSFLPTVLLSTHTAIKHAYRKDLTDDMMPILNHFNELNLSFNYILTGYFFNSTQINLFLKNMPVHNYLIVDPVMGDNGKLYQGFNREFTKNMLELCKCANLVLPNITEACFLADYPYREYFEKQDIIEIFNILKQKGLKDIIITSCPMPTYIMIASCIGNEIQFYTVSKINHTFYGTGDFFAALLTSSIINGKSIAEALESNIIYIQNCLNWVINCNFDVSLGLPIEHLLEREDFYEKK